MNGSAKCVPVSFAHWCDDEWGGERRHAGSGPLAGRRQARVLTEVHNGDHGDGEARNDGCDYSDP